MSTTSRQRLPNCRQSHTEALHVDGQAFTATVGFDLKDNTPRELFLTGGKEGSLLNAMTADAAAVISVALQHGVPGEALARSVGRLPAGPVTPAELDHAPGRKVPASPIGAALDLIAAFENEAAERYRPTASRVRAITARRPRVLSHHRHRLTMTAYSVHPDWRTEWVFLGRPNFGFMPWCLLA